MFTKRLTSSGFTIVEVTIALGLMALGGVALMAVGNYFLKARLAAESRSSHTNLRNLVQLALSQKVRTCTGGPTTCKVVNKCPTNLKAKLGNTLSISAAKITSGLPITESDNLELSVAMGNSGAGSGTNIAVSGGGVGVSGGAPSAREISDHLRYKILFVGDLKSKTSDKSLYSGSVEIIGTRSLQGRDDKLRASIPIELMFNNTTRQLDDCVARPVKRTIAKGVNTIDDCLEAGGVTVPVSIGSLCRFRLTQGFSVDLSALSCPDGFIGDPLVGCRVDSTAESPLMDSIPPCPAVAFAPSGCLDGFYRSEPGTGTCTACATPAVLGTGVLYKSTGSRTAPTDCEVVSIANCNAGYHLVGKTCLPDPPAGQINGCNLSGVFTGGFSSPTGANMTGGAVSVKYTGHSSPDTVTATISPNVGSRTHTSTTFRFSLLPQGNYTITLTDPLYGPECKVTLQKTLRVGGFFPDPVIDKGSLHCNYQGYPGGTPAPACPLDPVDPEDAADPDYEAPVPPGGWYETSFDATTNLRKCKYPFTCNYPDTPVVYQPPDGDGKTPSCIRAITSCPNTNPPSNPAPWIQISSPTNPLVCKLNTNLFPPPAPSGVSCSDYGLNELSPSESALPDVSTWIDSKHILCY